MAETRVRDGFITWVDEKGNKVTNSFPRNTACTVGDMITLKNVLLNYTACDTAKYGFREYNVRVPYDQLNPGHVDTKARIVAMDTDGKVYKWHLSAYNGPTEKEKQGYKIPDATAETIVAAIATFTQKTLTALRCPVIQTS